MGDLTIIVMSCDRYEDCWAPYRAAMQKFWQDCPYEQYLCTETKQSNWFSATIHSQAQTWSGRLMEVCRQIPTDYLMLTLDDFWLCKTVDSARVVQCLTLMQQEPQVGVIYLDEPLKNIFPQYHDQLFEIPPQTPYRINAGPALWNKSFLLSILKEAESAWDFERIGSFRACGDQKIALTASPQIFNRILHTGSVIRGKWVKTLKDALNEMDLKVDLSTRATESSYDRIKKHGINLIYNLNPALILRIQNWLYASKHKRS